MNERIRQLAEQAGLTTVADVYLMKKYMPNEVKFAELIVRECADIATMSQHQWASAGSYVLEHFGVKL